MRIGKLIGEMGVGDSGYTLPWALDVVKVAKGLEGRLRSDYPIEEDAYGTLRMYVERCSDGFHVWPPEDETYYPSTPSHLYDIHARIHETLDYNALWANRSRLLSPRCQ